jgi:hypothetical protein
MKYSRLLVLVSLFALWYLKVQGDTNFVATLNEKWRTQNATNVLAYVEAEYTANPSDPQRAFARGIVASELQLWFRGATNYLSLCAVQIASSTNYSVERKALLTNEISGHIQFFTTTAEVFSEPTNSVPQSNTSIQAELFSTCPSNFPYTSFLESLEP